MHWFVRRVSYSGALRRNKGYESRLQPPYENNISRCFASGYVDCSKVRLLVCCQPHYISYNATAEHSINFGSCCIRTRMRTYNLRRFGSVRNSAVQNRHGWRWFQAKAMFWLCQNSPSTDEQGSSSVDDSAILAAIVKHWRFLGIVSQSAATNRCRSDSSRSILLTASAVPPRMAVVSSRSDVFAQQKLAVKHCTRTYNVWRFLLPCCRL